MTEGTPSASRPAARRRVAGRPGLAVLRSLRRPGDRRHDARGRCSVCGAQTRFAYNSWILPADMAAELGALAGAFAARESLWCGSCGSSLRVRRIADVLLEHYADRADSLAALVEEPGFRALRVAEVNAVGSLHDVLAAHPRLTYSEYPDEDLCALSYADASFDLVLTSETLEHVPDFRAALAETRRVLAPGGRHVFTVPAVPGRERTVDRRAAGLPGQHHGRASGLLGLLTRRQPDMLVHTEFGADVVDELRAAGFEPELHAEGEGDVAAVYCARAGS